MAHTSARDGFFALDIPFVFAIQFTWNMIRRSRYQIQEPNLELIEF